MKSLHLAVVAFAAMGSAMSAQTHEGDPGGTIDVACSGESVRMAVTTMEQGNWAAQTGRVRMLSLARQACGKGTPVVTPMPLADQRWCQTVTTWSTSCLDRTATTRAADAYASAGRRRINEPDVTPTVEIAL